MFRVEKKNNIMRWVPVYAWAIVILFLSAYPSPPQVFPSVNNMDKVVHFAEFGILGFFVSRACLYSSKGRFYNNLLLGLILGGGYGILMELVQHFVPGRYPSLDDAAANTAGMIFGMVSMIIKSRKLIVWHK
ncbi:MAG: VanZ family protein [Candidatus Omnitrophota bacterium]